MVAVFFIGMKSGGTTARAVNITSLSGANLAPTVGLQTIVSDTDRHVIVLGADPIVSGARTGSIDPMFIAFSDQESRHLRSDSIFLNLVPLNILFTLQFINKVLNHFILLGLLFVAVLTIPAQRVAYLYAELLQGVAFVSNLAC